MKTLSFLFTGRAWLWLLRRLFGWPTDGWSLKSVLRVLLGVFFVLVVFAIVIAIVAPSGDDTQPTRTSRSEAAPTEPKSVREKIEDCLDPWDGNHNGFEDLVRVGLNDEGSMETHETFFGVNPVDGDVPIRMVYSAENQLGGRVKTEATGLLDIETCKVAVLDYGY